MATQTAIKAKAQKAQKQKTFVYEGTDKRGNTTKGEIRGTNLALAKAELRRRGFGGVKVKNKPADLFGEKQQKILPTDIMIFMRQMATMIKSGIPLVQSFEIVGDGLENPSMRALVVQIRDEVSAGNNFAPALRHHPKHFDDLVCNLIESGEQSGALETMLDRVATYKEKTEALKQKIKKATKYPIIVVCVAMVVTGILLVKVVPQFATTFANFGAELPAPTQVVMAISDWCVEWWFVVVLVIVGAVIAFKKACQTSKTFSDNVDKYILKMPVIGNIIYKSVIARFSRTLSTTFAAGVPLVDALSSVAGAAGNAVYSKAILKIRDEVTTGQTLNSSVRASNVFPNMVVQMIAIGEESGALDGMLDKVATYYEDEVDNLVDGLTSMLEPLIMSVLGVLVGGLLVAMYMPIFQLGQVV